ncbi:MAG: class II glutamine amidotransferase [Betaproteobacteria bacterium]|nr:MAG: class II glutamine amidotransferase [Betaproteobacteria bacterium]
MCRALLYLGEPVVLDDLLFQPDSALVKQTYMPKMLHLLNLAGFGMRAWDPSSRHPEVPFSYASDSLPVFDRNLKGLAEKIAAPCVLAHVRGVPYSTRVEIAPHNAHPFQFAGVPLALAHNGDLARFAEMKPLLMAHVKPHFAAQIRGTTDSEWIYALVVSALENPHARPQAGELHEAVAHALRVLREARAKLGIATASPVNLFLADGVQLAAARYCFDFGCYPADPAEFVAGHLNYYSLWYTAGRDYGMHDGEWKMTGGSGNATSVLVASEPLTRDTAAWVEIPEYCMLHASMAGGRPAITIRDLP